MTCNFEELFEQIKTIENTYKIKNGGKCYLIDKMWFDSFENYGKKKENQQKPPDFIDNSFLYDKNMHNCISHNAPPYRFKAISPKSFEILSKKIKIQPVLVSEYYFDYDDNIYKPVLCYNRVIVSYKDQRKSFVVFEGFDVENLHDKARIDLKVDRSMRTRLISSVTSSDVTQKMLDSANEGDSFQLVNDKRMMLFVPPMSSSRIPGTTGLQNLGNSCYMNSVLQCLTHTDFLSYLFLNCDFHSLLKIHGKFADAFYNVIFNIWNNTSGVYAPTGFKEYLREMKSIYAETSQEDAHEFLLFVLDSLHEEFNKASSKTSIDIIDGDGANDEYISKKRTQTEKLKNDSIIRDEFAGLLKNHVICPECGNTTVRFDPYMTISIPIGEKNVRKIKFIFVPFDFTEPLKEISLSVPTKVKQYELSPTASSAIGRKVKVCVATKSRSSESYLWEIGDESDKSNMYYLFEIPDTNHFYIPCNIEAKVRSNESVFCSTKDLTGPFLVQVDDRNENISKRCGEAIKALWELSEDDLSHPRFKLTDEKKDLMKSIVWSSHDFFNLPIRIKIKNGGKLIPDDEFSYLAKNSVAIEINKDYANDETFSYGALLQHYNSELNEIKQDLSSQVPPSLTKSMSLFVQSEVLDENNKWHCAHCNKDVCANKKTDIWSAPEVLIIHLKRFISSSSYYGSSIEKDDRNVEYQEYIDLDQYIMSRLSSESVRYVLYGVINHRGELNHGHYTAYVRVSQAHNHLGKWFLFDDNNCREVDKNEALNSSSAYILFYQRI